MTTTQNQHFARNIDSQLEAAINHLLRYGKGAERVRQLQAASHHWHEAQHVAPETRELAYAA